MIGFSEGDYEGLEDMPNSPCTVTAVVAGQVLEIPLQIRFTPRNVPNSPTCIGGKNCFIKMHTNSSIIDTCPRGHQIFTSVLT